MDIDITTLIALLGSAMGVLTVSLNLRGKIDDYSEKILFSKEPTFDQKSYDLKKNIDERIFVMVGLILFYGSVLSAFGFLVDLPKISSFNQYFIKLIGIMAWIGGIATAILGWEKHCKLKDHINKGKDEDSELFQHKVVALDNIGDDLILDMAQGNYFRANIVGQSTVSVINPPSHGTVGKFELELINGGSHPLTFWEGFRFPADFQGFSENGVDLIKGQTSDGGATWRLDILTQTYRREALILANQINPAAMNGCSIRYKSETNLHGNGSSFLAFDGSATETGEWESVFPNVTGEMALRFLINWSILEIPKKIGQHGAVFHIYGPCRYQTTESFVTLRVKGEVLDGGNWRYTGTSDWSNYTEKTNISPGESYRFRIVRDVCDAEDTLSEDALVSSISIEFVGEN